MNCPHDPKVAHGLCATCYQRKRRGKPLSDPPRTPIGESTQVAIRCSVDQRSAWEKAAKRAKQNFRNWIRSTLDRESQKL